MSLDTKAVAATLNRIMEQELAGTGCDTQYSLMTYRYNCTVIAGWLHSQASRTLARATAAGQMVTQPGERPSLAIAKLLETHKLIGNILRGSMQHERDPVELYHQVVKH